MGSGKILQASEKPKFDTPSIMDNVYTSSFVYNNPDSNLLTCKRLNKSVGMSWRYETGDYGNIISDFDTVYPWSDMKLCNLESNGNVIYYYGDEGFSYSYTQVMVEIPKFYYKVTNTGSSLDFSVSPIELPGFHLSPRHRRFGSMTKDFDKIYVGACYSNKMGYHTKGYSNFYTTGINAMMYPIHTGNGWYAQDYAMFQTLRILKIVELGTLYTGFKTGADTPLQNESGENFNNCLVTSDYTSMNARIENWITFKYRGIEMSDALNSVNNLFYRINQDNDNLNARFDIYMNPSMGLFEDGHQNITPDFSIPSDFRFGGNGYMIPYTYLECGMDEYDFVLCPKTKKTDYSIVLGNLTCWNGFESAYVSAEMHGGISTSGWCGCPRGMYLPPEV